MEEPEQDPVPDGELQRSVMSIIVAFGIRLSLKKPFPHILQEVVAVAKKRVHRVCRRLTLGVR
jgi:hypothetical protein